MNLIFFTRLLDNCLANVLAGLSRPTRLTASIASLHLPCRSTASVPPRTHKEFTGWVVEVGLGELPAHSQGSLAAIRYLNLAM